MDDCKLGFEKNILPFTKICPLKISCSQRLQYPERMLMLNQVLQKSISLEKAVFRKSPLQEQMPTIALRKNLLHLTDNYN